MKNRSHLLLVFALVAASQSYPLFEFRGDVLINNSFLYRGIIGEGHDGLLHCVTDNSDCCSNGEGNWYDETGGEVQQGSVGDRDRVYVTRGDGVVNMANNEMSFTLFHISPSETYKRQRYLQDIHQYIFHWSGHST